FRHNDRGPHHRPATQSPSTTRKCFTPAHRLRSPLHRTRLMTVTVTRALGRARGRATKNLDRHGCREWPVLARVLPRVLPHAPAPSSTSYAATGHTTIRVPRPDLHHPVEPPQPLTAPPSPRRPVGMPPSWLGPRPR